MRLPSSEPPPKKLTIERLANDTNVGIVVKTKTIVAIRWQDGTIVRNIPAVNLVPVLHVLHADFWPEDFVVDKASRKVGVVKRVIASERTCEVMWLDEQPADTTATPEQTGNGELNGNEEEAKPKTEEVSMYAIESHPDYDFRLGCVVVRLNKDFNTTDQTSEKEKEQEKEKDAKADSDAEDNGEAEEAADGEDLEEDGEEAAEDEEEPRVKKPLLLKKPKKSSPKSSIQKPNTPWVGQITGIGDGRITVRWVDGSAAIRVRPEELFRINEDDIEEEEDEEEWDDEYPQS